MGIPRPNIASTTFPSTQHATPSIDALLHHQTTHNHFSPSARPHSSINIFDYDFHIWACITFDSLTRRSSSLFTSGVTLVFMVERLNFGRMDGFALGHLYLFSEFMGYGSWSGRAGVLRRLHEDTSHR